MVIIASPIVFIGERIRISDGKTYEGNGTSYLEISDKKLQIMKDREEDDKNGNEYEFEFDIKYNTIDGYIAKNYDEVHSITFTTFSKLTTKSINTSEVSENIHIKAKYVDHIKILSKEINDSVAKIGNDTNLTENEEKKLIEYIDTLYVVMRNKMKNLFEIKKYPSSSVNYVEYEDVIHKYSFTLEKGEIQCLNELSGGNPNHTVRIYWKFEKDPKSEYIKRKGTSGITKEFVSSKKEQIVIPYEQK